MLLKAMNMIFEHINYRSFLKASLAEKIVKNPMYSLRSFAKTLGLSHTAVSLVLKGTKNISFERAMDVGTKLNLTEIEQEYFCLLVQIETVKDPEKKSSIQDRLNRLRPSKKSYDLSIDAFKAISDWYHFPILSMTRLKDFNFTHATIAHRLGITEMEVNVAIERLERLELIEIVDGKYQETKNYLMAQSSVPSTAIRTFHKQLLEKAMHAIDEHGPEEKVNGSETFAFNPTDLTEARTLTENYFDKMVELSEKSQKQNGATDIFHLQVNFFNLTKPKIKRGTK